MSSPTTTEVPLEKLRTLRALQERVRRRDQEQYARRRAELLEECPHPLALAVKLRPTTLRTTPAMDLLSQSWRDAVNTYDGRLTISMPPQHGKTVASRFAVLWALLQNPDRRVVYASYGVGLARTSGREIRNLVVAYGAPYGLRLDRSHFDATDWQLEGYAGGVLSAGLSSQLTGRPADVLVMDDLLPGEAEANSPAEKAKVHTWWESTARPRIGPGVPVIAIGTRWAEDDILSRFIEEGWTRLNIPARSDGATLDSVADVDGARTANGYLISARGTTEDDWETVRREVGERAWAALYQGRPAPLEGGVFKLAWFEEHRVPDPEDVPELAEVAVGVDPADTGTGDEAGVLVAGRAPDGQLYVLADHSGQLSEAQWARQTCLAWIEHGAARIILERTLGMQSSIPNAWSLIRRQAAALVDHGTVDRAVVALATAGDSVAADPALLTEVAPLAADVLERPSSGPRVEAVTPKQSKLVRAQSITGLFETGRAHIVGKLPQLEHECATWVPSARFSPARVDTLAHLLTRLDVARIPAVTSTPVRAGAGRGRVPTRSASDPRRRTRR